jgi:hypothetical protein
MSISICSKKYTNDNYCRINDDCHGWGCKHLLGIGFENSCYQFIHWYSFGQFTNGHTKFNVDKKQIREKLIQESELLKLSKCSHFNFQTVQDKINSLPDEIVIDGKLWTLMESKGEIVGVAPFEELNLDLLDGADWDVIWREAEI